MKNFESLDLTFLHDLNPKHLEVIIAQAQSILDIKTKQYEVKISWSGVMHIYNIKGSMIYFTLFMFDKDAYVIPYMYEDCTMRYCDPIKVKSHRPITLTAIIENVPQFNGMVYDSEVNIKKYNIKK